MTAASTQHPRRVLVWAFAALSLAWSVAALATYSLSFEGGGYWIDLEVGLDQTPTVASVRFHEPGDAQGVVLPRGHWRVDAFDTHRQVLLLRHVDRSGVVEPFTLSVQQRTAVLAIDDHKIRSRFRWSE